ncbi:MAG: putative tellurite resistance protein B-like protein [Cyclobacteriaceae bacterium]|jgi:uncharacterized tellurite resistance protein B-like protein
MLKDQVEVLVQLAHSDGNFDPSEKKLIATIALDGGMETSEVEELIFGAERSNSISELDEDKRFDVLYNMVPLMKVDGKVLDQEVTFCQKITAQLGYDLRVLMEIYSDVPHSVKTAG